MARTQSQAFRGGSVSAGESVAAGDIKKLILSYYNEDGSTPNQKEYDPLAQNDTTIPLGSLILKRHGIKVGVYNPIYGNEKEVELGGGDIIRLDANFATFNDEARTLYNSVRQALTDGNYPIIRMRFADSGGHDSYVEIPMFATTEHQYSLRSTVSVDGEFVEVQLTDDGSDDWVDVLQIDTGEGLQFLTFNYADFEEVSLPDATFRPENCTVYQYDTSDWSDLNQMNGGTLTIKVPYWDENFIRIVFDADPSAQYDETFGTGNHINIDVESEDGDKLRRAGTSATQIEGCHHYILKITGSVWELIDTARTFNDTYRVLADSHDTIPQFLGSKIEARNGIKASVENHGKVVIEPDVGNDPVARISDVMQLLESRILENLPIGAATEEIQAIGTTNGTLTMSLCHTYMNFEIRKAHGAVTATKAKVFVTNCNSTQKLRVVIFKPLYLFGAWRYALLACTDEIVIQSRAGQEYTPSDPNNLDAGGVVDLDITTVYSGDDLQTVANDNTVQSTDDIYIGVIADGNSFGAVGSHIANGGHVNTDANRLVAKKDNIYPDWDPTDNQQTPPKKNIDVNVTSIADGNRVYVELHNV